MRKLFLSVIALFVAANVASAEDKAWKKTLETDLNKEYPARTFGGLRGDIKDPGITLAVLQPGVLALCGPGLVLPATHVKNGRILNPASRVSGGQAILRPGTAVYVHDITVDDGDVRFKLATADKCTMAIHFEFEKEFLKTADVAAVKKQIMSVLASGEQVATLNQKTIELDQTIEQVEAILGKPQTVVKLGAKTTYIYKDMKVVFQDGKVADVQ